MARRSDKSRGLFKIIKSPHCKDIFKDATVSIKQPVYEKVKERTLQVIILASLLHCVPFLLLLVLQLFLHESISS